MRPLFQGLRVKAARTFLAVCALIPLGAIVVYVWNPLGVPDWDPRGRILGVIPYRVPSQSMAPTLDLNSMVVACTGAYLNAKPRVGDIIVFWPPARNEGVYLKRIVGVPGDQVVLDGLDFLRNGVRQVEPYAVKGPDYPESFSTKVPEGTVFVMGDNRDNSVDSRHFGPVPETSIIGKVCKTF